MARQSAKDENETPAEVDAEQQDTETQDEQPSEPEVPFEEPEPDAAPDAEPDEASPDGGEPDAPDEQAEPEQEKPSDHAQMQAFDKAQKRAENYLKAVVEILGAAAQDLHGCPRCGDFLPGLILPHAIKPVTPEQRVAVKVSMGEDAEPMYVLHRDSAACADCQGWGKVLTGSHVRGQDKVQCPNCQGRGFVGPLSQRTTFPTPAPELVAVGDNGTEPEPAPETDPWGRMKGDPSYGVLPGFEVT